MKNGDDLLPFSVKNHWKFTFKKAYEERKPSTGLLFHSDLGTQYTSFEFRELLRTYNVKQSYSNPGCPYDNAVSEGFFSIMKREELSHNWYQSLDDLQNTVDEYIGFFNTQRPFRKLGNLTPEQFEAKYRMDSIKGKPQRSSCVHEKVSHS